MSFKSKFFLAGSELKLNVQSINYNFHRSTNERGEATSHLFSGGITIGFEMAEDVKKLVKWAFDEQKRTRDCKIEFYSIKEGEQKSGEIQLKTCYLASYNLNFNHSGATNTIATIHLTFNEIDVDGEAWKSEALYA
jgi:hypothetical protein